MNGGWRDFRALRHRDASSWSEAETCGVAVFSVRMRPTLGQPVRRWLESGLRWQQCRWLLRPTSSPYPHSKSATLSSQYFGRRLQAVQQHQQHYFSRTRLDSTHQARYPATHSLLSVADPISRRPMTPIRRSLLTCLCLLEEVPLRSLLELLCLSEPQNLAVPRH